MNRHERRVAAVKQRRQQHRDETITLVLQVLESLAKSDETISGATLIMPDGEVKFIDAATMRRGGSA